MNIFGALQNSGAEGRSIHPSIHPSIHRSGHRPVVFKIDIFYAFVAIIPANSQPAEYK